LKKREETLASDSRKRNDREERDTKAKGNEDRNEGDEQGEKIPPIRQ